MQEKQVAVLIDGDNISPKYAEYIKQEAMRIGRIRIFRLYGSVSSPSVRSWYKVMPKHGISPMLQICYTRGKSIADQALTIDAMDILYGGEIDVICLVTSDSDFTKLAYRIKESGKMLIGLGEQKTNESFAQACDEFKVLDLIYKVEEIEEDEDTDSIEEDEDEQNVLEEIEEIDLADIVETISIPTEEDIVKIISDITEEDWENLSKIGAVIGKQIPGFDARNYGYKNMTQFIKKHQDIFELKFEDTGDGIHSVVYIRERKSPEKKS